MLVLQRVQMLVDQYHGIAQGFQLSHQVTVAVLAIDALQVV